MSRTVLEVCAASLEDAQAAVEGGADRIELNTALPLGGLTPSVGLMRQVRRAVRLPLMVMIRPREGGFCYSPASHRTMLEDIDCARNEGAEGIVLGALTPEATIDEDRMAIYVDRANEMEVVFHRAFDGVADPMPALESLVELGVTRVLTSGLAQTAPEGLACLQQLVQQSRGRIEVMPGSGINPANVEKVLQTGCRAVHGTFSRPCASPMAAPPRRLGFGGVGPGELGYRRTDADIVRQMRNCLDLGAAHGRG